MKIPLSEMETGVFWFDRGRLVLCVCYIIPANPWYMKYLLTTKEMIKKIEGMSHGGTMGILNVGKIRDLEIINPPLNLQESFLKISNQVRSVKSRCELVAANPLFDSLSRKAFSGQL